MGPWVCSSTGMGEPCMSGPCLAGSCPAYRLWMAAGSTACTLAATLRGVVGAVGHPSSWRVTLMADVSLSGHTYRHTAEWQLQTWQPQG